MSSRLRSLQSLLVAFAAMSIPFAASAFTDESQTSTDSTTKLNLETDGPHPNTDSTTKPNPEKAKLLNAVVVTGTHVAGRTEADSLSPIDVLSPKDLGATGFSDLGSALNSLLPSLDFPRPAINDGNDAVRPAILRGLSPDQVLVLVDGKRYHITPLINYNAGPGYGSSPVDLNSIPLSAIDHIEVLRDGASAQYGSDAVAGVINIVLKHGANDGTNSITVNGGGMSKGDGAQNGLAGSFGFKFGGTDANGKAPGWVRVSLNYQNAMNTNRADNTDRATTAPGALPPGEFGYQRYGDPAVRTYQGLVNFGYTFSPAVEAYGYFTASRRDVVSNGIYRAYNWSSNVPAVFPNGYLPQNLTHPNDLNGVIGLRGTTGGGWRWDASFDYGKSRLVFDLNSFNVNMYDALGYSPTYFYAGTYGYTQQVANFDMSKDVHVGFLPNAATLAWGAEFRRESYSITPGDPASYFYDPTYDPDGSGNGGSQGWPGIQPSSAGDWSRHDSAIYGDLETDLTDRLSAGLAARYEDYSDAGSALAGKLSARFNLTDTLALRGTVSNGFRAPSLAQEYYTSVTSIVQNHQLEYVGTFPATSPMAQALGGRALKPEKSMNFSLGLVWNPTDNFTSTLDAYQIRVSDRILYSNSIPLNDPSFGITGVQYFFNGATTRTRGMDWTNAYNMNMGAFGELNLTLSANWNATKFLSLMPPTYISGGEAVSTFGRNDQGNFTDGTPRTKYVFGGDWLYKGIDLHANVTRYGTVADLINVGEDGEDQTFAARWLLNVSASYNWDAWTFTLGADNLTNVYPTKAADSNPHELGPIFGVPYSPISPFGFNGRYIYGKVSYRF
jgi:iron complex outermembrane receptor protein